jgi:site-specific recombinase XerD
MACLLYGAGLRLMEGVRLHVKDLDFAYHQIIVRDSKGAQDRITMLPQSIHEPLQHHILAQLWSRRPKRLVPRV